MLGVVNQRVHPAPRVQRQCFEAEQLSKKDGELVGVRPGVRVGNEVNVCLKNVVGLVGDLAAPTLHLADVERDRLVPEVRLVYGDSPHVLTLFGASENLLGFLNGEVNGSGQNIGATLAGAHVGG